MKERRRTERIRAQEGTFIVFDRNCTKVAHLLDVSREGVGFLCVAEEDWNGAEAPRVDIVGLYEDRENFYISDVPLVAFLDRRTVAAPKGCRDRLVRFGVQFGALTPKQRALLNYHLLNRFPVESSSASWGWM